jgi:small subunit ribosomal protein S9
MAESKAKAKETVATGRRKTSVARIRIKDGSGKFVINGRSVESYFTEERDRNLCFGPLTTCDVRSRIDVRATVQGGGFTGQAGAICQGLARALKTLFGGDVKPAEGAAPPAEGDVNVGMVKKLRDSGFLTRDGRMKERKKYGRKGARKAFQFSKR